MGFSFKKKRKPDYDSLIAQLVDYASGTELTLAEHQQVADAIKTLSEAKESGSQKPKWQEVVEVAAPVLGSLGMTWMVLRAEANYVHPNSKAFAFLKNPKGR